MLPKERQSTGERECTGRAWLDGQNHENDWTQAKTCRWIEMRGEEESENQDEKTITKLLLYPL